jgi:hypothetical protein
MSDTTYSTGTITTPIPVGQLLPWALFGGLLMLMALYFISTEEGATRLLSGLEVHEFVQRSTSSARKKALPACSPASKSMNSFMTAATCWDSPATKRVPP